MIEVNNLTKKYRKQRALDDFSLELTNGKLVVLAGPNGSGKTSLLRILAGLDMAYTGDVFIQGQVPGLSTKNFVSYLPDKLFLPANRTALELIDLYQTFYADFNYARAQDLLAFLNVPSEKKVKELSKGMADKLQILLAMSREAGVYLLDEPLTGVDPATRKRIIQTIIKSFNDESLLLLSTHLLQEVEAIADEIVFIDQGKLVLQDSAENLRARNQQSVTGLFEEVFA